MAILRTNPDDYGPYKDIKPGKDNQFAEFKKYIIDKYSAAYEGKAFINNPTRFKIYINRTGLEHGMNRMGSLAKTKVITIIDKVLEECILIDVEVNRHLPTYKVYKFKDVVSIDGDLWNISIVVKESKNGKFFYDHALTKISKG